MKPLEIKPIAYEEGFPFPYNNFVYVVSIDREKSQPDHRLHASQPGTQKCPADLATFILRLPNPVSGYNDEVRVENEVAALSVARDALEKKHPGVVPRVFTWQSAKDNQGWMLQEHMPGEPLLEDFQKMSHQEQADILEQMADILACFQRHQLPESIKGYGGLSFDSAGNYISAPMGIMKGGPFPTYDVLVRETIQSKLAKADTDDQVDGWRDHGIRGRLDKFVKQGVQSVMSKGINDLPRVLVHADFCKFRRMFHQIPLTQHQRPTICCTIRPPTASQLSSTSTSRMSPLLQTSSSDLWDTASVVFPMQEMETLILWLYIMQCSLTFRMSCRHPMARYSGRQPKLGTTRFAREKFTGRAPSLT